MRSRTMLERFDVLYLMFIAIRNDLAFMMAAKQYIEDTMRITGVEYNQAELWSVLNAFEYDCSPADPAFCHVMGQVIEKLELQQA